MIYQMVSKGITLSRHKYSSGNLQSRIVQLTVHFSRATIASSLPTLQEFKAQTEALRLARSSENSDSGILLLPRLSDLMAQKTRTAGAGYLRIEGLPNFAVQNINRSFFFLFFNFYFIFTTLGEKTWCSRRNYPDTSFIPE